MRLHHINIAAPTSILEITRKFYCDILGLKVGPRPTLKAPGFWLYNEADPIVHLSESDIHSQPQRKYYLDHIAFSDAGLVARLKLLEDNDIEYAIRRIAEENITQIFVYDPCGNRLELNFSEVLSNP